MSQKGDDLLQALEILTKDALHGMVGGVRQKGLEMELGANGRGERFASTA